MIQFLKKLIIQLLEPYSNTVLIREQKGQYKEINNTFCEFEGDQEKNMELKEGEKDVIKNQFQLVRDEERAHMGQDFTVENNVRNS